MSGGRVDADPRGALSLGVGPGGVSYRHRLEHAGLVFCGRSVCWGSKELRPVTSRPQRGKTAARWTRAPGGRVCDAPTTNL